MWREYSLHSSECRSADDGVVSCWAIDYQKMGIVNRSFRGGADSKWELDTFDWLDNITRETQKKGDICVEVPLFYAEGVERIGEEHIDRATGVNKDSSYVKIRNIGSDDHRIGMGEDNVLLLFLGKGDGFPADSSNFVVAPSNYVEDMRMPNGTHVPFKKAVAGVGYGSSSTDLLICWFAGCSGVGFVLRC